MGLHCAMETCGYGPRDVFLHLAGSVDLFLFDIKETDARRHLALTGVELAPILDNLRALHDPLPFSAPSARHRVAPLP